MLVETRSEPSAVEGARITAKTRRIIETTEIRFSEIISALSVALDITQGHPEGHCMRSAMIGMRLAEELELSSADSSALFYALLLKDLGCSSNAAKITHLFGGDDHAIKHGTRLIDWTKPGECVRHCWSHCAPSGSKVQKLSTVAKVLALGPKHGKEIAEVRCERGAEIAQMLKLPQATAAAIFDLDEHWDGHGNSRGLKGNEISLLGRICCLAQTVEVFFTAYGLRPAIEIAEQRRARWFDAELVDCLLTLQGDTAFWNRLKSKDLSTELSHWEPDDAVMIADEACLDRVSEAFAMVVDAKSPWTYQHSTRVAEITLGVASQFGCSAELKRDLRRTALLHDIGKLGVSNAILDKPGKLTDEEFAQVRRHAEYSERILERIGAFAELARVAGGHHERLDGRGYHQGLKGDEIDWATRVLTIADICEALSAERPYRKAMTWEQIRDILTKDVGTGVDGDCLAALEGWQNQNALESRVEGQLAEIDQMLSSV